MLTSVGGGWTGGLGFAALFNDVRFAVLKSNSNKILAMFNRNIARISGHDWGILGGHTLIELMLFPDW